MSNLKILEWNFLLEGIAIFAQVNKIDGVRYVNKFVFIGCLNINLNWSNACNHNLYLYEKTQYQSILSIRIILLHNLIMYHRTYINRHPKLLSEEYVYI